jgi:hypothetical protein
MNQPNHKEQTNWEHCCSCCPDLEKRNKHLAGKYIKHKKEIDKLDYDVRYWKQQTYQAEDYNKILEQRISDLIDRLSCQNG